VIAALIHFSRQAPNGRIFVPAFALVPLLGVLAGNVLGAETADDGNLRKLDPRLQKFFTAKERHGRSLAKELNVEVAPEMWDYFDAGSKGDWITVRKLWRDLSRRSGQYAGGEMDETVRNIVWSPLLEAELAYECFTAMAMKFVEAFARDTIDSIPRGSIYFGGTDPGRGVITAFCKSHADADPFFVLSQNPLPDGGYLQYLRTTFGKKIYVPSEADSKDAFEEYKADAAERSKRGALKPGEQFSERGGRIQISGQVSVMAISAIIARMIFDGNPQREFYVQESFALDWMYPHLTPHGPIMKVNRQPLSEIDDSVLKKDREYWRRQTARFVGDWLEEETSLKTVCEFVERVYLEGNLDGFKGDPLYVTADKSYSPRPLYGKLRQSQATLYAWRLDRAATPSEKDSMKRAAELAFKQTLAFCPDSSEYVRLFVNLLKGQKRLSDARLVLETGLKINPNSRRLGQLADELKGN
jgi:hypothetical protein